MRGIKEVEMSKMNLDDFLKLVPDEVKDKMDKEMSDALQAEIRNKLTPFWTLTELMADEETWSKMNIHFDGKTIIENLVRQCNYNKRIILELINQV